MKKAFSPENLTYLEKCIDLTGVVATFIAWVDTTQTKAVIQMPDGTVVTRNKSNLREYVEAENVTIEVSMTLEQLKAAANYPMGSVCNPFVLACKNYLKSGN